MEKNTLKYVVLFLCTIWVDSFLRSSPIDNSTMMVLSILLPVLAGGISVFIFNPHAKSAERIIKVSAGAAMASCGYIAFLYSGDIARNYISNSQPEIVAWAAQTIYDWLCLLIPALLYAGALIYAFINQVTVKKIASILGSFSIIAVLLSILIQICAFRIVPSAIVGDFGATIGTNFQWVFIGLKSLVFPAIILFLNLVADRAINQNHKTVL